MYISKENRAKILDAFNSYGQWSNNADRSEQNRIYAMYRQACAIRQLVELGFDHHLREWADKILSNEIFTEAVYK